MIVNLFFNTKVYCQSNRQVSFEQRAICEKNNGLWREFGNACADDCYSKFDEFAICTHDRNFSCDCGRGKCWNNEKCIAVLEYKKIYDDIKQEDIELMSMAKKRRIAKAQKYQQDLIRNMIENRSSLIVAKFDKDQIIKPHNNFSSNNYGEVYAKKYPELAKDKNYITNFDERSGGSGPADPNRLKSIQFQKKEPIIDVNNPSQVNYQRVANDPSQMTTPVYNNQVNSDNQQIIIQQQGNEDQVVNNQNNIPVEGNSGMVVVDKTDFLKNNPQNPPVESFEIPTDFLNNTNNQNKTNKANQTQLPVVDLPR